MNEEQKIICPRCNCCEMVFVDCDNCRGECGHYYVDSLEIDDPYSYDNDDFEQCNWCNGEGGHWECIGNCDDNGKHNSTH